MLLTRPSPPRAWFVPVVGLLAGAGFTLMLAVQAAGGAENGSRIGALLGVFFFGAITWMFFRDVALMTGEGGSVVIRGPGRERTLVAGRCRIGVTYRPGGRMASFALLVTDGDAMAEFGEWTSSKAAGRAAVRIERAFGMDDGAATRANAAAIVTRMERRWQGELEKGQAVIDAYYQSPAWRRVKYGGPLLVLLYLIGMTIYIRFWGR